MVNSNMWWKWTPTAALAAVSPQQEPLQRGNSGCKCGYMNGRDHTKRGWVRLKYRPKLPHTQAACVMYICVCVCACLCAGRVNHSTRPIISCGFCSILYWQHKKGSEKEDNRTTWWHSSACYSVFGRLSFVSIKKDLKRRKSERFVLQSHRRYFTYTLQLLASFMYDKQTHF